MGERVELDRVVPAGPESVRSGRRETRGRVVTRPAYRVTMSNGRLGAVGGGRGGRGARGGGLARTATQSGHGGRRRGIGVGAGASVAGKSTGVSGGRGAGQAGTTTGVRAGGRGGGDRRPAAAHGSREQHGRPAATAVLVLAAAASRRRHDDGCAGETSPRPDSINGCRTFSDS